MHWTGWSRWYRERWPVPPWVHVCAYRSPAASCSSTAGNVRVPAVRPQQLTAKSCIPLKKRLPIQSRKPNKSESRHLRFTTHCVLLIVRLDLNRADSLQQPYDRRSSPDYSRLARARAYRPREAHSASTSPWIRTRRLHCCTAPAAAVKSHYCYCCETQNTKAGWL